MHYILDSSVIVKWFDYHGEDYIEQALKLMDLYGENLIEITIPDLSLYEIANALKHNKNFSSEDVKKVISTLIGMSFNIVRVKEDLLNSAIEIAFEDNITVYDAIFISVSEALMIPLVTANPRHHDRSKRSNIIMLEDIKK